MNNLIPVNDVEKMATAVAKSGLFGVKSPEQAMALMLVAQAEGLHPATAARDYHVIQGRPALKTDAMMARFQAAGGKVEWKEYTDDKVTGVFSHPAGGSLEVTWTLDQAKRIGLAGKDNWKNYPRAMLRSRVVSEGIRSVYPGCVVGVYTPEEVADFTPERPSKKSKEIDAEDVEVILEEAKAGKETWELQIPGKPTVTCDSQEEWQEDLLILVGKVAGSKMSIEQKTSKLAELKKVNEDAFRKIGLAGTTKLYETMARMISNSVEDNDERAAA